MQWPRVPHDFTLGVLMLDTRFPRPSGDIGNPATFPFPVDYLTVPRAVVSSVVTDKPLPHALVAAFLDGARTLEARGAGLITTSCGFLSPLQGRLGAHVCVPVVTSSLTLLPRLCRRCGGGELGVLTFDRTRLAPHHIPDTDCRVHVAGLESGTELHRVISRDEPDLDPVRAAADMRDATRRLVDAAPPLAAIVIECTNIAPYRDIAVRDAGCSVYDIRHVIAAALPGADPDFIFNSQHCGPGD